MRCATTYALAIACLLLPLRASAVDILTDPLGDCKRVVKPKEQASPAPRAMLIPTKVKPAAAPASAASSPKLKKHRHHRSKAKAEAPVEYEYDCPPLQFPKLTAGLFPPAGDAPPAADVPATQAEPLAPPGPFLPPEKYEEATPAATSVPCECFQGVDGPPIYGGWPVAFAGSIGYPSGMPPSYPMAVPEPVEMTYVLVGLILVGWRLRHV